MAQNMFYKQKFSVLKVVKHKAVSSATYSSSNVYRVLCSDAFRGLTSPNGFHCVTTTSNCFLFVNHAWKFPARRLRNVLFVFAFCRLIASGPFTMAMSDGRTTPRDILSIKGPYAVQSYLVNEIQEVYSGFQFV